MQLDSPYQLGMEGVIDGDAPPDPLPLECEPYKSDADALSESTLEKMRAIDSPVGTREQSDCRTVGSSLR